MKKPMNKRKKKECKHNPKNYKIINGYNYPTPNGKEVFIESDLELPYFIGDIHLINTHRKKIEKIICEKCNKDIKIFKGEWYQYAV